ncbi:MAG: hypothetical protein J6V25_08445 [Oscillospiraceae bacterium]|nr:hypothetical protein [Oscillospiraceae bacterium]
MAGYFVIGALAAFGAMSLLWAVLGWLLPGGKGCALVCWGMPDEGILSRYRWLYAMGLLRCPLLAVTEQDAACPELEICTGQMLLHRLEWEREQVHGAGNGDHPRCDQRRGVSEL